MKEQYKQVIVIRKDLNMRKGKTVAQGAHASMAAILRNNKLIKNNQVEEWLQNSFTKVCVSVDSEQQLLEVYNKAKLRGLMCSLIKDNGTTEFKGKKTFTAVAVGPGVVEEVNQITGHLPLL